MDRRLPAYAAAFCATGLLLWACSDYGAFLEPAKTVVAVAVPALGLLWAVWSALGRRRVRQQWAAGWQTAAAAAETRARAGVDLLEASLVTLGLLGLLSASWSLDYHASLRASGILLGGWVYLHLGRSVGTISPRARLMLLRALSTVGAVMAVLSVTGYLFRWGRFSLEKDGILAATGTLGYANALAGLLLLTLAATVAVVIETEGGMHPPLLVARPFSRFGTLSLLPKALGRLAALLAVGVQLAALVLTWSKGAAAAIVIVIAVWLLARAFAAPHRSPRQRWLGVVLAVVLIVGSAAGGYALWRDIAPQMAVSGLPPAGADPKDVVPMTSGAFRIKTWGAALEAAGERPVAGWGLDTFYEAYKPFKLGGHTAYAHNVVVQHLVEVGGLGTALLFAFLVAATVLPVRTLLGPLRDPRIPLALGAQAFVLHNLVDLTWYFPALFFMFTLILGLAVSAPSTARPAPPVPGSSPDRAPTDHVISCRRRFK